MFTFLAKKCIKLNRALLSAFGWGCNDGGIGWAC